MKYVEIIAHAGSRDTIAALAEKYKAHDFRSGMVAEDGLLQMRLLIAKERLQQVLDALQILLGAQPSARVVVLDVAVILPPVPTTTTAPSSQKAITAVRESLYKEVAQGGVVDSNYVVLLFLSTVVAAVGLIEDNVAVIIGAMVIAPLLGPNLAFSLGTALGDGVLMRQAAKTLLIGLVLATGLAVLVGVLWPEPLRSQELLSRTVVGLDSVALALASGAAAALSLTTGLPSVLVGVMVAVALLPPTVTVGMMLGQAQFEHATAALLLLSVNIVSVNLASKLIFLVKGIQPRTWREKAKARTAIINYILGWVVSLLLLMGLIYLRRG